jgi:hypothetical protein
VRKCARGPMAELLANKEPIEQAQRAGQTDDEG